MGQEIKALSKPDQVYLAKGSALMSNLHQPQADIDSMVAEFTNRNARRPSEMIYLQTSKGIYETGEDLWFKAYQFDVRTFELSAQSKTLHLQMINDRDSVIWQEKYLIENGIAAGHVYVDDKLPDGDYSLEAYTKTSFYNDTTEILTAKRIRIVANIAQNTQSLPSGNAKGKNDSGSKAGSKPQHEMNGNSKTDSKSVIETSSGNRSVLMAGSETSSSLTPSNSDLRSTTNMSDKTLVTTTSVTEEQPSPSSPAVSSRAVRLGIFPEGGNLVAGIKSRLAFKATDAETGIPTEVRGTLLQDGEVLTTLQSHHDGMGVIEFTPLANKNYYIELSDRERYMLPRVYAEGITLRLGSQSEQQLEFTVRQSPGMAVKEVYLMGQIRGMVFCVAKGVLRDSLAIKIPIQDVPDQGIA